MSKLVVPAVDAARAKTLARAVQRRHQELGTTVSLNHAYEAVAAVCGFETWSRMKARLDECWVEPEQPNDPPRLCLEQVLAHSSLSFDNFVPHDVTPSLVVSGPDGDVQRKILADLISRWRRVHGLDARIRLITKRPKADYVERMTHALVSGGRGGIDANLQVLRIRSMGGIRLNPFDTPLGQRYPTPAHRERLVDLLALIMTDGDREPSGVRALAGLLVDVAYDTVSGRRRDSKPKLFALGMDKRIDGNVYCNVGTATWWDVADELAQRGNLELAAQAQAFAVPQLELMMHLLRDENAMSMYQSAMAFNGERLLDFAARKIASAVRECNCLHSPSNTTINPDIRSIIIDVDGDDNPAFFGNLTSKIFSDLCFSSDHLSGQAALKERTLVIFDGLDDVSFQKFLVDIEPLFRGTDKKKLHTIAMTRSAQQAASHSEASSFLLHGFESRAEVNDFRKVVEFSDEAFENAHNFLFDRDRSQCLALGVRRGYRTVADGMVAIP